MCAESRQPLEDQRLTELPTGLHLHSDILILHDFHAKPHTHTIGWAGESTYRPLLMVDLRVDRPAWSGLLGDVVEEREQEGWVFFELILKL